MQQDVTLSRSEQALDAQPRNEQQRTMSARHEPRPVWPAVKRGLRGRCPACGEGRMFRGYSKVNDLCPHCGEELFHQQADDFPQYVTIFVVGHALIAALLFVDDFWPNIPVAYHFVLWPSLVVLLCLWILPLSKGALIAYQWALRMHGFETAPTGVIPDPKGHIATDGAPLPDAPEIQRPSVA